MITYQHKNADPLHNNINNNREQTFYITRLKEPKDDIKYLMPKGAGTYPFFPPALVDKFEKEEEIKTLVLTEGYFKAFKASLHGWDIVGLSSITHYADKKTKLMHPDIINLIQTCKVKNVVMLYDGDCLNISLKALETGDDLAKRPHIFQNSMLKIRELLTDMDVSIYFAHVMSDNFPNKPKGLDDLLIDQKGKEKEILDNLMKLASPGYYFFRLNVSSFPKKLQGIFSLKSVDQFYGQWSEYIGEREFNYFGTRYKCNREGKLEMTVPAEARNFMRVGDEYYEIIELPTIFGDTETSLTKRNKSTITDDFGKQIIKSIPKYKAFTNMPSHTNYQQVINNCYNRYAPFTHEPEPGEFETIDFFIKHIFQEHYEYGLDYIQILYQHPTQILPILCLVSKENQTGKTTFLDFLKMIFGENCVKVGNSEIASEFNAFLTTRLVVGVDETFIEKQAVAERIKMLSTANRVASQRKGVDHEETWHFAKYILTSNNETKFINAKADDIRYWVRKIPKIQKVIPNLLNDMHEEIPAFLYFLNNRKISVPKVSRAWFDPDLLETDALHRLKEANRPQCEKEIRNYIHEVFLDFPDTELMYSVQALKDHCNLKRWDDTYIHTILSENMRLSKYKNSDGKEVPKRFSVPYHAFSEFDNKEETKYKRYEPARPYVFYEADFLTKAEIEEKEKRFANNPEIEDNPQIEIPY